jgi:hypothetical protein
MTDASGSRFKDEGLAKNDLILQNGTVTWQNLTELICSPPATDLSKLVPGTVDIPAQIYTWLRIPRQESWSLDGRIWQDQ